MIYLKSMFDFDKKKKHIEYRQNFKKVPIVMYK